jgi:hypothetical protein
MFHTLDQATPRLLRRNSDGNSNGDGGGGGDGGDGGGRESDGSWRRQGR